MRLKFLYLAAACSAFAHATTTVSPVEFFRARIAESAPIKHETLSAHFEDSPSFQTDCVTETTEPAQAGESEAALLARLLPDTFSGTSAFRYSKDPLAGFDIAFHFTGGDWPPAEHLLDCETEKDKHDCTALGAEWKDEFQSRARKDKYGPVQREVSARFSVYNANELYVRMQVDLTLVEHNLGGYVDRFNSKHSMGRLYFCRLTRL